MNMHGLNASMPKLIVLGFILKKGIRRGQVDVSNATIIATVATLRTGASTTSRLGETALTTGKTITQKGDLSKRGGPN